MYKRFLNDNDYLSVITAEALAQMTRNNPERFIQAEESAEMSIIENLSENYEIEQELNKGKYIAGHDRRITFPVGAFIYLEGRIYEVIRSMSGYKVPSTKIYWEEHVDFNLNIGEVARYSQFATYHTGDLVTYNGVAYRCVEENGYQFGDIRIPMVGGWLEKETEEWLPIPYGVWEVVSFEGAFYALLTLDGFDNNSNPMDSDCWGAVADYAPNFNEYELEEQEYVVCEGKVFYPGMDVNADMPIVGHNIALNDPRNYNIKKHMVRLSVYELTKLIAPNNVGSLRMKDHEDSMKWLHDASKLRLNPQIPRKLAEDKRPVTDWQLSTFQTDYDPYKNPWLT